jgi:hypothetical protein
MLMKPRHHLRTKAAIVIAAAVTSLYLAAATLGASGAAGGHVQVFITPSLTGKGGGPIIITGAIGDHGKSIKVNASGQPDPKGTHSLAKLQYGSILFNTRPLRKAIQVGTEKATPDLASCSLQGSTTANVPIISGTRQYSGITGTLHVRFTFAEVAGRYSRGPKQGKCNLAAGPVAQWASVVGAGSVTFT